MTANGEAQCRIAGLQISNGLAWTADKRMFFHSDTGAGFIDRYVFDPATGEISERSRIVMQDDEAGRPDGGACDAQGRYWFAGVTAGCLNCFAPDGALLARIPLPIDGPTSPCFGGDGFATLFVRSPKRADSIEQAGGIHSLEPGMRGVAAFRFGV